MPAIYLHRHQVALDEIDRLGHVNNLAYLRWMQDAAVAHSAAEGWDSARYRELGTAWVVRRHAIEYRRPCHDGDAIVVATWVHNFRRIRSLRKYQIVRCRRGAPESERPERDPPESARPGGADTTPVLLAVAETLWAYVQLPDYTPRAAPRELSGAFELVETDPTWEELSALTQASL